MGGTPTHCVLTAHSGMRNLSMFDDITRWSPATWCCCCAMNKTLAYKMVDSEVVAARGDGVMTIEPGADKVTLVTCTPYGVNDHRLLVHCAHQVQQEGRRQAKSLAGRHWEQARVRRAHRGRSHCAVAAGHRDSRAVRKRHKAETSA